MEINDSRDIFKVYLNNLMGVQKLCEQTVLVASHYGDQQMAGFCFLILTQVNVLVDNLRQILGQIEEKEDAENAQPGYDLLDLWKHMGGN